MSAWVRTNRRAPGADYEDPNAERRPGPWHEVREHGQTWCGRRPKMLAVERAAEPPEGERRCAECVKAKADNRPRPRRSRR